MLVRVVFHGLLAQWVCPRDQFHLPAGAGLPDLLEAIGRRHGPRLPAQLWDQQRHRFAPPVVAFAGGVKLDDHAHPLQDGQEVKFLLMMGGG